MKTNLLKNIILLSAVCLAGFCSSGVTIYASGGANIEQRLFERLENAVANGRILEVKSDIQRVLRLNPKHTGATFFAGLYAYEKGNFKEAERFFLRLENDKKYGLKAREYLAEIGYNRYRQSFKGTLDILLSGESYEDALRLCEEALKDIPDNPDVLFAAAFSAAMLGIPDKAFNYADLYKKYTKDKSTGLELYSFINAWFAEPYEEEEALEKLLNITNRKILTDAVKRRIKDLIKQLHKPDRFEAFIEREKLVAGADTGALDRELAEFYISDFQYDKALRLLSDKPIDNLEDNLLFVKVLSIRGDETTAISAAGSLIDAYKDDLRVYEAYTGAYLRVYRRTKSVPKGKDTHGRDVFETVKMILEIVKPEKIVNTEPGLLLNLLQIAIITGEDKAKDKIFKSAANIHFDDDMTKMLLDCTDELIECGGRSMAISLLESAVKQQPQNHKPLVKLARVLMKDTPHAALEPLEKFLETKPNNLPVLFLWVEAMSKTGGAAIAEQELVKRLDEPDLTDIVRRQLSAHLATLRLEQAKTDEKEKASAQNAGIEAANEE